MPGTVRTKISQEATKETKVKEKAKQRRAVIGKTQHIAGSSEKERAQTVTSASTAITPDTTSLVRFASGSIKKAVVRKVAIAHTSTRNN